MELVSVRTSESPSGQGRVRLIGELAYDDRPGKREECWFEVPEEHAESLSLSGNPWLTCLLPLAVTLGQPLRLCAPVDPELRAGAARVMQMWEEWFPRLHPVEIEAVSKPSELDGGPREVAGFFSGGIDSFYMVLKNREAVHPPALPAITRLLSVWGFDIPIQADDEFRRLRSRLSDAARELGKDFVDVATNLRETRFRETNWGRLAHGGALAAVALTLERRFRVVYIAGTHSDGPERPWGSHPGTDPLLSTTITRFVHNGNGIRRAEKTVYLSGSDLAMRSLHVCFRIRSAENCSDCPKCLLAMLTFEVLGVRERASTFRARPIDLDRVRRIYLRSAAHVRFYQDIALRARAAGLLELADAIDACVRRSLRLQPLVRSLDWMKTRRGLWRVARRLRPLVLRDSPQ
jgi:hypothetical protein